MSTFSRLWQNLAEFFLEWEILQIKVVEKIKTHILCTVTFSRKSCRSWDMSKNEVEPQRPQKIWRMPVACWISKATRAQAHARAIASATTPKCTNALTHARAHTLRICRSYCFPTATMVSWTRLNVTFCVHCLSCYLCGLLGCEVV